LVGTPVIIFPSIIQPSWRPQGAFLVDGKCGVSVFVFAVVGSFVFLSWWTVPWLGAVSPLFFYLAFLCEFSLRQVPTLKRFCGCFSREVVLLPYWVFFVLGISGPGISLTQPVCFESYHLHFAQPGQRTYSVTCFSGLAGESLTVCLDCSNLDLQSGDFTFYLEGQMVFSVACRDFCFFWRVVLGEAGAFRSLFAALSLRLSRFPEDKRRPGGMASGDNMGFCAGFRVLFRACSLWRGGSCGLVPRVF